MRTFGAESARYFEFQLAGDDKVYKIPLLAHMPYGQIIKMNEARGREDRFKAQVDMLRAYMGDVVDAIDANTLSDIALAWIEESNSRQGATVGESQASSD